MAKRAQRTTAPKVSMAADQTSVKTRRSARSAGRDEDVLRSSADERGRKKGGKGKKGGVRAGKEDGTSKTEKSQTAPTLETAPSPEAVCEIRAEENEGDWEEEGQGEQQATGDYEMRRLENMRRNAGILQSLGISSDLSALSRALVIESHPQRAAGASASRKRKPREETKIRRSVRSKNSRRHLAAEAENDALVVASPPSSTSSSRDQSPVRHVPTHILPLRFSDLDEGEGKACRALIEWRNKVADEAQLSRYMIVQNRSMCEIVRLRPSSLQELLLVWGLGAARIEKYGACLLEILAAQAHLLRTGPRPILDSQEQDQSGVAVTAEERRRGGEGDMAAREGKVLKTGDRWKKLDWDYLDRLERGADATVTLRHNASNVFRKNLAASDSLSEALQYIARIGKKKANPKITGFIKVVENAKLDDVPLPLLLEGAASALFRGSSASSA